LELDNMTQKHLAYKTSANTISVGVPIAKEIFQKELSIIGKIKFIANEKIENRLKWAKAVKAWDAITDDEYQSFMECHLPADKQYHYWIDESKLANHCDLHRDAWCDIDSAGNVRHDLERARQLILDKLQIQSRELAKELRLQQDLALDMQLIDKETAELQTLRAKINIVKTISVNTIEDLNNLLKTEGIL